MDRSYAGVLGSIAFSAVLARGWLHGVEGSAVLLSASACLFLFGALGACVGRIADAVVDAAVLAEVDSLWKTHRLAREPGSGAPAGREPR
jgi:hypothetical protein